MKTDCAAPAGPDALIIPGDITDDEDRRRVVERTLERFGAIDILINNAGIGIYSPPGTRPWRTRAASWS